MIIVQLHEISGRLAQRIRVTGLAVQDVDSREIVSHDGYALFKDDGHGDVNLVEWTRQLVYRFREAAWDLAYEYSLKDYEHVSKKLPLGSRWWLHQALLPTWWDPKNPRVPRDTGPRPEQPQRAQAAITHHSCGWTCLLLADGTQYGSQNIRRPLRDEVLPFVAGEHGDPIPDSIIEAATIKLRRPMPEHRVERVGD